MAKKQDYGNKKLPPPQPDKRTIRIALFVMLLVTFVALSPSLKNGFTNWDDDHYVTSNPFIQELSWQGIENIFTTIVVGNYHPLTVLSYAIEYHFFQLNPSVYHTTNLVFHLANCLLLFWLMILLSKNITVSFIVGLLFGIHPLHVESVAWISERKDVLFSFFFLSAIISYLYYIFKNNNRWYYGWSIILFILSCLSKGMAVVFPCILMIVDYLTGRGISRNTLKEKIPYVLTSLVFGVLAVIAQHAAGAIRGQAMVPMLERPLIACYGLLFYLYKLFVPINLSCLYPYPAKPGGTLPAIVLTAPLIVGVMGWLLYSVKKFRVHIVFGSMFYIVCLLPVLQLVPVGYAVVADRYFYLSSIGIFYILATGFTSFYERLATQQNVVRILLLSASLCIVFTLSYLTWRRSEIWNDSITLLQDAVAQYPAVPSLYNNIGMAYGERENVAKALENYRKAIELDSTIVEPYMNMGYTYAMMNEYDKSIGCYQKVIGLEPNAVLAYHDAGILCAKEGKDSLAVSYLRRAAQLGHSESRQWLQENGLDW